MIENIVQGVAMIGWFLIILIPLVMIHEFGHLLMARLTKTRVVEYGIGIPPRWIKKKWRGIIWSLNYLPLGGFVRIYGDHDALDEAKEKQKKFPQEAREGYASDRFSEIINNGELEYFLKENNLDYSPDWKAFERYITSSRTKNEAEQEEQFTNQVKQLKTLIDWDYKTKLQSKKAFFNKNWWQQTLILLGGIVFNLATAFIIFWLLFGAIGTSTRALPLPQYNELKNNPGVNLVQARESPQVRAVIADYPASQIGMEPRDEFISFAGVPLNQIQTIQDFSQLVEENKEKTVEVVYRDDSTGELVTAETGLRTEDGSTFFGIGQLYYEGSYSATNFFSAAGLAFETVEYYFTTTFEVLGQIIIALLPQTEDRSALQMVSGPIGVSYFSGEIFEQAGFQGVLELIAIISISLAVFNLLPLPALDGGRIVIAWVNKATGRRNKKLEGVLITATMVLMLFIGVLVAWQDINTIQNFGG